MDSMKASTRWPDRKVDLGLSIKLFQWNERLGMSSTATGLADEGRRDVQYCHRLS